MPKTIQGVGRYAEGCPESDGCPTPARVQSLAHEKSPELRVNI
jgi:hypothetical protein